MATNTDEHNQAVQNVQSEEHRLYYTVRPISTADSYPNPSTVTYPTTGQTYPIGIPEAH